MSSENLWKEYVEVKYSENVNKKINVLLKCTEQTDDALLSRSAKRDLGLIYFQGDDAVKNTAKAKKYLSEAAEEGDENAKQFYGIMLYNEGNFASFYYFREAMELGNIHSAYMMYDNLHMKEDNGIAKKIKSTIEEQIEYLVDTCQRKIVRGDDENGVPQFALALVGLYDLGDKLGIDRSKGQEYLKLALEKDNANAQFMQQNPVLMKPETMNQYKPPSVEEMKEMEEAIAGEHLSQNASGRKGRMKKLLILAVIIAVIAIIYACREMIVNTAVSVFNAIIPILSVAFLLVVAYVVYGDDKDSSRSKSSSSDWNPMQEFNDNRNCKNMPSCIYDSSNNRWDKVYAYENSAVYKNFDYGETTITYCDISGKYASGSGGQFHWY